MAMQEKRHLSGAARISSKWCLNVLCGFGRHPSPPVTSSPALSCSLCSETQLLSSLWIIVLLCSGDDFVLFMVMIPIFFYVSSTEFWVVSFSLLTFLYCNCFTFCRSEVPGYIFHISLVSKSFFIISNSFYEPFSPLSRLWCFRRFACLRDRQAD